MSEAFDFTPSKGTPPGANVMTVTELSRRLRGVVESTFARVAVEGEISGLKVAASGHAYFSLKDEGAVINAIVWRGTLDKMSFRIEDGMHVVAYGKVTTYDQRSNYQIIVDRIEPAGLGALMLRFEELRKKLEAEGLFNIENKKPLPFLPQVIGMVTSPTGAVIDDMLTRLNQKFPRHVLLWPVKVQGPGAKEEIAAAIDGFNALPEGGAIPRPDVLIVARGGGSLEDLWPFNEEIVVRAVARSAIPVISGVGHEPDTTLCDYAADFRAPTPTAAAVEVVPDRRELWRQISRDGTRLGTLLRTRLQRMAESLRLYRRALPDPQSKLVQARLRLDDRDSRLRSALKNTLVRQQQQVKNLQDRARPQLLRQFFARQGEGVQRWQQRLQSAVRLQLQQKQQQVDKQAHRLEPQRLQQRLKTLAKQLAAREQLLHNLSPEAPLKRGYVYVTDDKGQVVRSAKTDHHDVVLHFADGRRGARMNPLQNKDK